MTRDELKPLVYEYLRKNYTFSVRGNIDDDEINPILDALDALNQGPKRAAELEEVSKNLLASLVAATSLLEKGGKKAAPSDKMFAIMLKDYEASIERGRAALKGQDNEQ
jgi:hypothetical protein